MDERLRSESQFHRQLLQAELQERSSLETALQRELDDARAQASVLADQAAVAERDKQARRTAETEAEAMRQNLTHAQV
ncbi:unnamed protein product [Protopolystoma xenopodis]|uniref:Uncharacterized protein n=1 Tax=Protopolystoma xenopodis TaxID=117903 RepID=A0A3S5CM05_9PLAT|nr:unnamed protein product [Protopolystoma xenopodis]